MSVVDGIMMKVGGYPLYMRRAQVLHARQAARLRRIEATCAETVLAQLGGRRIAAEVITIISTFRRPELVKRAVASALGQDVDGHHVIVVDDGAGLPDDLAADDRVSWLSLPVNTKAAGVVRNVALRVSDSRYVAFLDDDNTWTPDHLRRSLEVHTGAVMLSYTGIRRGYSDGRLHDVLNEPWSRRRMRRFSFVDTSAIVVRRFPGLQLARLTARAGAPAEDWQLAWTFSARHPVVHVDAVTVNYTVDQPGRYSRWRDRFVKEREAG
jgi:hypothetical protein